MRHVLIALALALVSCAADPVPGPYRDPLCEPMVRCTHKDYCADMTAFCDCSELKQDKPNECVYCRAESGKTFVPRSGPFCFYKVPK